MNGSTRSIRLTARVLRRRPASSAVILLTLGVGMAAMISVFSVVEAFLLRPLGIDHLDRVVRVREVLPREGGAGATVSLSPATYALWSRADSPLADLAAATGGDVNLTGHGDPLRLRAARVSANFFAVLGVHPIVGRTFARGEDQAGRDGEVILGYGVWQRVFAGGRDVIGKVIVLDGSPKRVIGILPRGFSHPYQGEIWEPLVLGDSVHQVGSYYLYAPARLKPGISLQQAQRRLDTLARRSSEAYPDLTRAQGVRLTPLRQEVLGDVAPVLYLLTIGAALVLAAATLNVINLIVAANLREARSASIRLALGARFRDLLLPSMLHYLLLVGLAVAAALPLISVAVRPLVGLSGVSAINEFDTGVRVNAGTIGVAAALAILLGLILSIVDSIMVKRRGLSTLWTAAGRSASMSRRSRRKMHALVLTQIAASFLLVVFGLSVAIGYHRLMRRDRGFSSDHVLTADIAFAGTRYADVAARSELVDRVLRSVRRLPGVVAAGASSVTPDYPGTWGRGFEVEGVQSPDPPGYFVTNDRVVTPGYFAAMHIPLLRGRVFDDRDRTGAARTVIVSRSFAARFWPQVEPVGKRVRRVSGGTAGEWMTVVGVVGDVEEAARDQVLDMRRAWYRPCAQDCDVPGLTFVLTGSETPPDLPDRVRAAVHGADPDLAVFHVASLRSRLAERFDRELFVTVLLGLFALAGVAITMAGVYAVASVSVAARKKEFGIRIALGAHPGSVARSLLTGYVWLFTLGVLAGCPVIWLGLRWIRGGVAELGAAGPGVLAIAVVSLLAVGCSALLAPIVVVMRLHPTAVLNVE